MRRPLTAADEGTFAERIAAARAQQFVGRSSELDRWRAFIRPGDERPLWFIAGPGGIGKSMLLRAFQADAVARGLHPLYLDARHIPPNAPAVRGALTQAAGGRSLAEYCADHAVPLLLIDTFEYWEELEHWFRQTFLPAHPASLKVVFTGRRGPSQEWQTDAGWRPLLTVSTLPRLSENECGAYLWRRHVTDADQSRLIAFSGGHPLALAIAADAVRAGQPVMDSVSKADSGLIQPLVESFTREAVSAGQRRALDAAAVVRELNPSLLAQMLDMDDASDLFAWLGRLSFMASQENGISPHDLVRDSLMRDMPNRAPGQYEWLARNATEWIVNRLETSQALTWDAAAGLAADAMYALRAAPMVRYFMSPVGNRSLYLDRWRPGDEAVIHAMIARHEGDDSLHWFMFWRARAPDSVIVVRDAGQRPVALFLKLDMETLDARARETDPLTRNLWQALQKQFNLHPGDHVPFIRHWVTHDYAISDSPEKTRILMAIHTYNLTAKNLRLSAQVFDETGQWEVPAAALGIRLLHDSDTVIGGKNWRIYYNDWAREPPSRYYRLFAARVLGFDPAEFAESSVPPAAESSGRPDDLDESAFGRAVADALKHFNRPRKLRQNELLNCALVSAEAGGDADTKARIPCLRLGIEAAVAELSENGAAGRRQSRVLRGAYLDPAGSQKAAAAALHMGYSTFRRHLAESRETLAAELWRREKLHR